MSDEIATPILAVDTHGEVYLFSSIRAAEGELETVDVEDDEYVFYDADGTILAAELVEPVGAWTTGRWRLVSPTEKVRDVDSFRKHLARFLIQLGRRKTDASDQWIEQAPIDDLVKIASAFPTG